MDENNNEWKDDPMIRLGLEEGIIKIQGNRITYPNGKSYNFKDPEEKVRARVFVELVKKYKYSEKSIDTEVYSPRREPKLPADIVVYEDDDKEIVFIVVETKGYSTRDDLEEARREGLGNANLSNSKYLLVVCAYERMSYSLIRHPSTVSKLEKYRVADIPVRYGREPKFRFKRGDKENDLRIATFKELDSKFQLCHDEIWEGGKRDPAVAFDEISKLIITKLYDERYIAHGEYYKFQIGTYEEPKDIAKRVKKIYETVQTRNFEVFKANIQLPDSTISRIVEHLQDISLRKTDLDAKGRAFEQFLGKIFRGEYGQYFTPRQIVEFMVSILDPDEMDYMIDPACGSGGFLLYSMRNVLDKVTKRYKEDKETIDRLNWDFSHKQIFGIEINDRIARVAMMDMVIHEDGHSNIECNDALEDYDKFDKRKSIQPNKYSLLLTNPPFGAEVKIRGHKYLKDYELGGRSNRSKQKTEILFIERCLDFLSENGRMGIVLPDGILMSKSLKYVRNFINEKSQILAVVSLPQSAFMPSGTGVKSSLLFLRKKKLGEKIKPSYLVFMAMAQHIGYDATGKWDENQLPDIIKCWQEFKEEGGIKRDQKNIYTTSFDKIRKENRLDPYYFQPKFEKSEESIKSFGNVKRIEDIVDFLEYGLMPTQDYARTSQEGVPMIRVTNITGGGRIDMSDVKFIPFNTPKLNEKRVREGDVLLVQCGNTTGKTALVPKELEGYTYGSFCFAIRPKKNVLLPEYFELVLRSVIGQCQIWRTINIATVRPNTSKPAVKNILIPIPSLNTQRKIVEEVREKRDKIRQMSKEIKMLNDSIDNIVPEKLKIKMNYF